MSLRKIFEKWPECRTISPMPSQTRFCTRSTMASLDLAMAHVAPPEQHIGIFQALLGQAMFRHVQRGGFKGDVRGAVEGLGNGAVNSLRVEFGHQRIGFFVLVLVPDQGADRHRCSLNPCR